jgi:ATPase subunit of ABC transporter with duplicated ATPase domains
MANEVILTADNLSISFGDKPIITNASFGIHSEDKLGIVGVTVVAKAHC